jgi:hypothetical protein
MPPMLELNQAHALVDKSVHIGLFGILGPLVGSLAQSQNQGALGS